MTKLILILLAIFIVLTIFRKFLRKNKISSTEQNKPNQKSRLDKEKDKKNDDDAVDAKFEEIN